MKNSMGMGKGLVLLVCIGVAVNLNIGLFGTWSLFEKAYISDYGWSHLMASLPYSIGVACYSPGLILAGLVQGKVSAGNTLRLAALFFAIAMVGSALSRTAAAVTLIYGLFVGGGVSFAYISTLNLVMQQVGLKHRGLSSGLMLGAFGLSSAYLAPIVSAAIKGGGVSRAYYLLAAIIVPLLLAASVLIGRRGPGEIEPPKEKAPGTKHDYRAWLTSRPFWLMSFIYFAGTLAGLMLAGHIAHIAFVQTGIKSATALVSGYAIANCLGRVCSGFICDRMSPMRLMAIVFFVNAINMGFFALYNNPGILMLGLALAGITNGCTMVATPQVIAAQFPARDFAVVFSLVSLSSGLAGFLGPTIAGLVVDNTGTYNIAYIFGCVVMIASALTAWLAMKNKRSGEGEIEAQSAV